MLTDRIKIDFGKNMSGTRLNFAYQFTNGATWENNDSVLVMTNAQNDNPNGNIIPLPTSGYTLSIELQGDLFTPSNTTSDYNVTPDDISFEILS